jgi:hypothetical protein
MPQSPVPGGRRNARPIGHTFFALFDLFALVSILATESNLKGCEGQCTCPLVTQQASVNRGFLNAWHTSLSTHTPVVVANSSCGISAAEFVRKFLNVVSRSR